MLSSSLETSVDTSAASPLQARIVRSAPALGHHPVDVLVRILNVARFAVDAVLSVDDVARPVRLLQPFVHARRAVAGRQASIYVVLGVFLYGGVCDAQVDRLVLLMVRARERDVGQPVKREDTVRLGIGDRL